MDLVLAAPGVGRLLELATHLLEAQRQERRVPRVEAVGVEAGAGELQAPPEQGEGGGGGAGVGGEAQALRRPRPVRGPVDAVGRHVGRRVLRELEDLDVARAGERAHQEAEEGDQDQEQGEDEPEEDLELDARARGGTMRCTTGSIFFSPSSGATR